jgi:hypothetical protein
VWNHAVFSKKTHDRLSTSDVAQQFFAEVNKRAKMFMSDEHFTGDSALIQACVSQNSFRNEDDLMMATGKILAHISFEASIVSLRFVSLAGNYRAGESSRATHVELREMHPEFPPLLPLAVV